MTHPAYLTGYQEALNGAVYYPVPDPGYLRVTGDDRSAFFQRQTTNDVNLMKSGRSLVTVLTSPTARILDVLWLVDEEEAIGVITLPGQGAATGRYLKSRIFFMDKVSLSDQGDAFAQFDLEGPQAAQALPTLGFDHAPELDEVVVKDFVGGQVRAIGQRGLAETGFRLLVPVGEQEALLHALTGIETPCLSESAHHILRVEAGLPASKAELTGEYTPLETGLEWAVSDHKGCYTGQEVIARQVTYDKVTQHLAGLRLSVPASAGDRVTVDGRPAGVITSAATSPRFGEIALSILKKPHDQIGSTVLVSSGDGSSHPAQVCALPFH